MNLRTGFVAAGEVSPASLPGLPLLLTLQGSLSVRLTSEPCPWSSFASKLTWRRKLDKRGYVRGWPCLSFEISSQNVLDTLSQHPQRHRWVYIKLSAALSLWTKVPHSSPFSLSYHEMIMQYLEADFLKNWREAQPQLFVGRDWFLFPSRCRNTERADPEGTRSLTPPRTLENGRSENVDNGTDTLFSERLSSSVSLWKSGRQDEGSSQLLGELARKLTSPNPYQFRLG